ncbi:PCI domain containing protein [Trichuris trichiura]|uniref:COP9 signalosome complex subunit 3 n=1 Tax=Trichuris trichiura TaxID=36087 RepID=A0A077ZAR7_TRITR|nr:PCI domain containing protein [Trichuris trichiura]
MEFRDSFVHKVRIFSTNAQFPLLVTYLNGLLDNGPIENPQDLVDLWQYLKQRESTLPMLGILFLRITYHATAFTTNELIDWCTYFLDNFNSAMVSLMADTYFDLWHQVADTLIDRKEPSRGINCLRLAIIRFVPSLEILTPIHSDLFMLCLYSSNLKPALPFLGVQISAVFGENTEENKGQTKGDGTKVLRMEQNAPSFDVKYYLLYCYYGGCIYAAMKLMRDALYMFELAITIPSEGANDIVTHAYKKWVLTSLLVSGKLEVVPAYTASFDRFNSCSFGWYCNLADAYKRADFAELNRICTSRHQSFVQDKNDGLVNQVKKYCAKKHILALSKVYAVMSLTALAEHCQLPNAEQAERLLFDMAARDEVRVKIDQKNGTVSFFQEPVKTSLVESLKRLEMTLSIVQNLDKNLTSSIEESKRKYTREDVPLLQEDEGMCDSVSGMRDFIEELNGEV